MCQRNIYSRSTSRIAEEVQLLAEEEFMIEALKKLKHQRNCLQIERLHLESLKAQLENSGNSSGGNEQSVEQEPSKEVEEPTSTKQTELKSAVDMMAQGSMQHKYDFADMDDIQCNNQELNLNLNITGSRSHTSQPIYSRYDDYQSDEGSSSDVSDVDDVVIDINMLMNGSRSYN